MTTREAAIVSAADVLADAYVALYGLDGTSIEDAARAAYTPGGRSIEQIEASIRARRAAASTSVAS